MSQQHSSDKGFCLPSHRTMKPSKSMLKRPSKSYPIRECQPSPSHISLVGRYPKYLESVALHFQKTNGLRNAPCCSRTAVMQSMVCIFLNNGDINTFFSLSWTKQGFNPSYSVASHSVLEYVLFTPHAWPINMCGYTTQVKVSINWVEFEHIKERKASPLPQ